MKQTSFAKPLVGLGTTMAAAVLAMALVSPPVNAQGKGGDRGGSGPSASPGGGKGGGGSMSGGDSGRSTAPSGRSGNSFSSGRDSGRSVTEKSGPRSGKQHSERRDGDRRRHSRRGGGGGVDFGYYGYGYVSECDWLYRRAVNSGSGYWWRRYRACTND